MGDTVGQLLLDTGLVRPPLTCACGHKAIDHRSFSRQCDECGCARYDDAPTGSPS